MTTGLTAGAALHGDARTRRSRRLVRRLGATVSGMLLAVTVVVCAQGRTDLRRSRSWLEMAHGQLRQAQGELAQARSDRTALLMTRTRRPMAAELPTILRQLPTARAPHLIIATVDAWRIVRQPQPGATDREDVVFPRAPAEEQSDAAYLGG